MDKEFIEFLIKQFNKLPTKNDLSREINGLRSEMHGEFAKVRADMLSKAEFYAEFDPMKRNVSSIRTELTEVKEIVRRLDSRTDEDLRAVIKDVAKIKTYLSDKGHQI